MDRDGLELPGDQDELVARVAAVNPRTVVVLNTPGPVLMPWLDDVAAVLQVWYPGEQFGAALAAVLFGDEEPGGRLPLTFPRDRAHLPGGDVGPGDAPDAAAVRRGRGDRVPLGRRPQARRPLPVRLRARLCGDAAGGGRRGGRPRRASASSCRGRIRATGRPRTWRRPTSSSTASTTARLSSASPGCRSRPARRGTARSGPPPTPSSVTTPPLDGAPSSPDTTPSAIGAHALDPGDPRLEWTKPKVSIGAPRVMGASSGRIPNRRRHDDQSAADGPGVAVRRASQLTGGRDSTTTTRPGRQAFRR